MSAAFQAVLLDAAGTLVSIEPPAPRLRGLLADRFGVAVTVEQARVAIHAEITYYRGHMHEGTDSESLVDLRRRCAEVLRESLPTSVALRAVIADELVEVLVASLVFKPFPEVPAVLSTLRAAGLRLVVASNWDCSLETVLERIGVRALVDGVVCSAVVGAAKPDPDLLRAALRLADAPPEAALHVGDSFTEDVGAALAAGVRPVFLNRDGGPVSQAPGRAGRTGAGPPAVTMIGSLAELPALLELA